MKPLDIHNQLIPILCLGSMVIGLLMPMLLPKNKGIKKRSAIVFVFSINDSASIEFAVGFYDALGASKSVEEAFKFGRSALRLFNLPKRILPVLKKTKDMKKKTLASLQGSVIAFGFLVYTWYDEKVNEIRKIYNLKRDFQRLTNVFASKDN